MIGVNTAVSSQGQNIGFAIPINKVKESLKNFNSTGQFDKPLLGVSYAIITRKLSVANDIQEGAYVQKVAADSSAQEAGIKIGDIITRINDQKISEKNQSLAQIIAKNKVGDTITLVLYRDEKEVTIKAKLKSASEESK